MNMVLVDIDKISYDPNSKGYLVMLKSFENDDYLEILVNTKDAKQISLAKEGINLPRPSSHDLLLDIIGRFNAKLKKIIITDYKTSTYYAKIILHNINSGEIGIDCRPSDAIVLSLRSSCPLYINKKILSNILSENKEEFDNEENAEILLKNLNKALDKAIMLEEYETAAKLRDQINDLLKDVTAG